ncbi:DUF4430 domain-containing protein [Lederbergia citrisecunda]|uniref:DUF4430 domain-containing protein n=1 Tax=Lederbergia citrisecunda TaxID=2833583 RepID=UPI003D289489
MRDWKTLKNLLLVLTLSVILAACGTSLQKPTGLEDEEKQTELAGGDYQKENDTPVEEESSAENNDAEIENAVDEPETSPLEPEKAKEDSNDKKNSPAEAAPKEKKTEKSSSVVAEKPATASPKSTTKPSEKPSATQSEKSIEKPVEKPVKKEEPTKKEEENPATKPSEEKPAKQVNQVVYSIVISSSEVPLQPTELEIEEGETVLSALIKMTKKHKIQMDYRGGQGATAYIEGIANVYEFDRGQGSGWMYRVNGIFPDRGAGVVPLQDGDRVEWLYTTNLGVDLNADLKPFRR